MARKETRDSLEALHHQQVGSLVSRRLHASYKSAEEALASLDVPPDFVALACRLGHYDEAKQWAALGLKHEIAVLRAREKNGLLAAGPEDDQAGFTAVFCAATPVFWSFAHRNRPKGDDFHIMRKGLEFCARIAEATVEELGRLPPDERAQPRHSNIAAHRVFTHLLVPAVAINAGALVHKGHALHLEMKRLLKGLPKPARTTGKEWFRIHDAVFAPLFAGQPKAFGKALAEMWRATDVPDPRALRFHAQFRLISLWMAAERHWGKPVAVDIEPPLKGFGFRAYWGED